MHRLTVLITCKNEREHIRACIASAQQVADEVLVADSGSTDGTLEIARSLGCRIIEREYVTSGDFKNWAIPQATHEWVLILDADERLSAELANEIREVLIAPKHDGYWIYRLNYFMGHPIRFGLWKNDCCLRLFRRDLGQYAGRTDHAEVELSTGNVGCLATRMTHHTCNSYSQYLPKLSRYAEVQAQLWLQRGRRARFSNLLLRFPLRFFQGYIWRMGFRDGLAGLQVCVLVAYLSWLKHAYLWQMNRGRDWQEIEKESEPNTDHPLLKSQHCLEYEDDGQTTAHEKSLGGADYREVTPRDHCADSTVRPNKKRTLRAWRHQLTPAWLTTDARRKWRDLLFRRLGIQRCHTPRILTRQPDMILRSCLPFVVAQELLKNPRLTFVQIGAFDGVGDDDLRALVIAHQLSGVLIEPQPAAFAKLQHAYRNQSSVKLLQAAIAEQEGTRDLFCRRGEASMAASFDREHLRRHGIPDSEIVSQPVACHTVASALRVAGLDRVDLIQIDAEGYDWPIIRSIDFERLRPKILRFEYRHMSDRDADDCLRFLVDRGYRFIIEARDIIAHRDEASAAKCAAA